jgi:hypothetical protein
MGSQTNRSRVRHLILRDALVVCWVCGGNDLEPAARPQGLQRATRPGGPARFRST